MAVIYNDTKKSYLKSMLSFDLSINKRIMKQCLKNIINVFNIDHLLSIDSAKTFLKDHVTLKTRVMAEVNSALLHRNKLHLKNIFK